VSQLGRGLDGGLVLRAKARLLAVGPDLLDAERPACQERERQGRPEDLAASLAPRAVQPDDVAATARPPRFRTHHPQLRPTCLPGPDRTMRARARARAVGRVRPPA